MHLVFFGKSGVTIPREKNSEAQPRTFYRKKKKSRNPRLGRGWRRTPVPLPPTAPMVRPQRRRAAHPRRRPERPRMRAGRPPRRLRARPQRRAQRPPRRLWWRPARHAKEGREARAAMEKGQGGHPSGGSVRGSRGRSVGQGGPRDDFVGGSRDRRGGLGAPCSSLVSGLQDAVESNTASG
jgi:hypothetical protein